MQDWTNDVGFLVGSRTQTVSRFFLANNIADIRRELAMVSP